MNDIFDLANAFTPAQVNFQKQMVQHHNQLRARHCAAGLQLDDALSTIAQAYAEKLAAQNLFQHSGNGYGENLYMMSSWQSLASLNGKIINSRRLAKMDQCSLFFRKCTNSIMV